MSSKVAPGEKPQIEGVREQRVTVFVVNAFLGKKIVIKPNKNGNEAFVYDGFRISKFEKNSTVSAIIRKTSQQEFEVLQFNLENFIVLPQPL